MIRKNRKNIEFRQLEIDKGYIKNAHRVQPEAAVSQK